MKRGTFLAKFLLTLPILLVPSFLKSQDMIMTKDEFSKQLENAKTLGDLAVIIERMSSMESNFSIEGPWSIGTVFSHCAQSIRYSISGYPEMKSAIFRGTLGNIAFSIFSLRGKMRHGLEEPIPGGEKLEFKIPFLNGKKELIEAMSYFESTKTEDLKPHFAYGALSKKDYDTAHVLHIKNHFERIYLI